MGVRRQCNCRQWGPELTFLIPPLLLPSPLPFTCHQIDYDYLLSSQKRESIYSAIKQLPVIVADNIGQCGVGGEWHPIHTCRG